jgi:hypothetical protein
MVKRKFILYRFLQRKKHSKTNTVLPNSALVPTESLQKVQVESEVESLAEIKEEPIKKWLSILQK